MATVSVGRGAKPTQSVYRGLMVDAGARTDRFLVDGQTIMTFKFADLVEMSESLTYNAYPVLAYTEPDDGQLGRAEASA